jgi:hypothetical protein
MSRLKKFEQFLNRFWTLEKRFSEKVTLKTLVITSLKSVLMTMIWFIIPILMLLNLSIWMHLRMYLVAAFILLLYGVIYTYSVYFLKWIVIEQPNLEPLNLKWLFLIERRLVMGILTLVLMAVMIGNLR